jgi:hypothetical protein
MAYSKAKLKSSGDKASPCFRPVWIGKLSDKCLPIRTSNNCTKEIIRIHASGSLCQMTSKGNMTTAAFINWIHHLSKYKVAEPCLIIPDGAKSNLITGWQKIAERFYIILFCLPRT